eukprot:m.1333924 g.1333924  ORF g.1333924 m.1333924 type:complete len:63 (-) comp24872_c0_seq10:1895-2083(-)
MYLCGTRMHIRSLQPRVSVPFDVMSDVCMYFCRWYDEGWNLLAVLVLVFAVLLSMVMGYFSV